MTRQADALKLPHVLLPVSEPYEKSYEDQLKQLQDNYEIEVLISGDIDEVAGHASWIVDRSRLLNLKVIRPLWKCSREQLAQEILARNIRAKITWINHPAIPSRLKGRILDQNLIDELKEIANHTGIDLCGENGEYHTIVISAPIFGNLSL